MRNRLMNFIKDESGPTASEYAVCLACVFLVLFMCIVVFGETLHDMYDAITGTILK